MKERKRERERVPLIELQEKKINNIKIFAVESEKCNYSSRTRNGFEFIFESYSSMRSISCEVRM